MNFYFILFIIFYFQFSFAEDTTKGKIYKKEIISKAYLLDKVYPSMKGPQSTTQITLGANQKELYWITGFEASIVDGKSHEPVSQEYMCHTNFDFKNSQDYIRTVTKVGISNRLFTISQGQKKLHFPEGFGIPVNSLEPFYLNTQVLNLNPLKQKRTIGHKVTVYYQKDKELKKPLVPLMQKGIMALAVVNGKKGYYDIEKPMTETHGPSCLPADSASKNIRTDNFGRQFTGHWVVKPGREINHTNISKYFKLHYDTTVHYILVHLHPFAESLTLKDLTTGTVLFRSAVTNYKEKIGIKTIEHFSSKDGLKLYKNHQYQLTSIYNNTSNKDQDSMAVMYLYLKNKKFDPASMGF